MNTDTRQYVIKLFAWCIASIAAAITAVLLLRVILDGNAPLVSQITQGFINALPQLVGFLTATILGEPALSALASRILSSSPAGQTTTTTQTIQTTQAPQQAAQAVQATQGETQP